MAVPKDIVLVESIDEFRNIQTYFNIDDLMFQRGYIYARTILEGHTKTEAYFRAYKCDRVTAQKRSSAFMLRKWVQELVRAMRPNDDVLYVGEINIIVKTAMKIIMDTRSSNREVTEAMKAVQPYIKQQQALVEHKLIIDDKEESKMDKFLEIANGLANQGKMIGTKGEVIDVQEIL